MAGGFTCPADLQGAWAYLRNKIENGDDLTPHLSRSVRKDFDDLLLNDWGIHHLHLGTALDPDGFASRTGPVVFARVTLDEFFAIDVRQHGRWSDRDLMEAIHDNWPDTIRQHRMVGVDSIEADLTSEEIRVFRRCGITGHLQMPDGTAYFPLGGGYATDGTSTRAVATSDAWLDHVRNLERHLQDNIKQVVAWFEKAGQPIVPPYEFRLDVGNGRFRAVEVRTNLAMPFEEPGAS